jgi:hypothetical protein
MSMLARQVVVVLTTESCSIFISLCDTFVDLAHRSSLVLIILILERDVVFSQS